MIAGSNGARRGLFLSLADAAIIAASLFVAQSIYHHGNIPVIETTHVLLAVPTTMVVFHLIGAYRTLDQPARSGWYGPILVGIAILIALFVLTDYLLKISTQFPRWITGVWLLLAVVGMFAVRMVVRFALMQRARRGFGLRKIILAGSGRHCLSALDTIDRHPLYGFEVVAICADGIEKLADRPEIHVRPLAYLPKLVDDPYVYQVIVCGPIGDQDLVLRIFSLLKDHPVDLRWIPDLSEMPLFCLRVGDFSGTPILNLSASPLSPAGNLVKWLEDKIVALAALIVFSPILCAVAVIIKLTSPGPILFVQDRHGQYGKRISVYKFRSMHAGDRPPPASSRAATGLLALSALPAGGGNIPLAVYEPQLRDSRASTSSASALVEPPLAGSRTGDRSSDDFRQATANDPRITPFGAFIRRTSLDELPQLLNVLKGDMSIVGPRPHPIKLNQQYRGSIAELMRRHYMKPGITGLAQVNGARGETRVEADMRKRVAFDLAYIRQWSLWLDLRIIVKTAFKGFITHQP